MTYRVEITARAERNLRRIYRTINAAHSAQAWAWFNDLEAAILSLDAYPARGSPTPEDRRFRHLLHGSKPHVYRVIYAIDEQRKVVTVLHVRHGARRPLRPRKPA
jgi:plasmid stabilization system protein ParE